MAKESLSGASTLAYEKMQDAIEGMTADTALEVLSSLQAADCSPELVFKYAFRLTALETQTPGTLGKSVPALLSIARRLGDCTSMLFLLLEHLQGKKEEGLRACVLEALGKAKFGVGSILGLLRKADSAEAVVGVLATNESVTDEFIHNALLIDDSTAIKNLSQVLPRLSVRHFLNYSEYLFLLDEENYSIRCAFLEIVENLIIHFRAQGALEPIEELLRILEERLCDVNFYVRSRVLGCFSSLFRQDCILKNLRNQIVQSIAGRVLDKAVVVRRKAAGMLGQILVNHPFKDRHVLEIANRDSIEKPSKMEADYQEFVVLMEKTLEIIVSLLDTALKTEVTEVALFIKTAYLLKLRGSDSAARKLLGLVFGKDKQIVIEAFGEIISRSPNSVYDFIENKAFDIILRSLSIDERVLYSNIFSGQMVHESMYILEQLEGRISEEKALALVRQTTEILFASSNEKELVKNIKTYCRSLSVARRTRTRISHSSELLRLANKNIVKMIFFEPTLVRATVRLFFAVSHSPEKNCQKLLRNLSLAKSSLKMLDAIGWIGICFAQLLERMEQRLKGTASGMAPQMAKSIDEFKRLSANGSELRERRKSIEESRRNSLGGPRASLRMSLRMDGLSEAMKDKTDEELSDFFFYLKEQELLYSDKALLAQFVPFILESVKSANTAIQAVAYSSLGALMLLSSSFFSANLGLFITALHHESPAIRNNAVVLLHDFIIYYNTSVDASVLFDCLEDRLVAKNALLVIYSLIYKNVLRLKGYATKLALVLFDPEIGPIAQAIIKHISSNNNIMSTVFYEVFLSNLETEYVTFLAGFVSPSIHEALFLKCLLSGQATERLRCVYDSFSLSDKFISENMYREEMRLVSGQEGKAVVN